MHIAVSAYTMNHAPTVKCIVRLYKSVSQQEKHLVIANHINHLLKKKRNEITDNQYSNILSGASINA